MVDPFAMTIIKLKEMGFFHLLLYILSTAVFYGLLRKTQLFGPPERNVAVNATVAFVAGFMVLAVPILRGIDIVAQFEMFFVQSVSAILVMMVGVMIAGLVFPPDLPGHLAKVWGKGRPWGVVLIVGVIIAFAVLLTSGMTNIFFPEGAGIGALPEDTLITVVVIIALIAAIGLIIWFTTKSA